MLTRKEGCGARMWMLLMTVDLLCRWEESTRTGQRQRLDYQQDRCCLGSMIESSYTSTRTVFVIVMVVEVVILFRDGKVVVSERSF